MTKSDTPANTTRRRFLKQSGAVAAGTTVLGGLTPAVHAGEDNTIRLALIGCGGRGTGAVRDATSVQGQGPIQLHVMADLQQNRMDAMHKALKDKLTKLYSDEYEELTSR